MKNKLKDKITKFEEITVNLNDDKKNIYKMSFFL